MTNENVHMDMTCKPQANQPARQTFTQISQQHPGGCGSLASERIKEQFARSSEKNGEERATKNWLGNDWSIDGICRLIGE